MRTTQIILELIKLTKENKLIWHSPELYQYITIYKDVTIIAEDDYTGGGLQNKRDTYIEFRHEDKTWKYDGVEVIKLLHAISDQMVIFDKAIRKQNEIRRGN
tara:strand:+ start:4607 stop:4912 length:306 start_codon:yes stop_codon:yes gene_type:complete